MSLQILISRATHKNEWLRMLLAFIAGVLFTAMLAFSAAGLVYPHKAAPHDTLTPAGIPDEGYLV